MAPTGLAAVADQLEQAARVEPAADQLAALVEALRRSLAIGARIAVDRGSIRVSFDAGVALSIAPVVTVNFDALVDEVTRLVAARSTSDRDEPESVGRLVDLFNSDEVTAALDRGVDRDPDLLV